ncbi:hypothetical protein BC828DRAFT_407697 [Blastocladiella britannica]|nr:hypothetical protein BC828DRAFT_407697 [Blastocladiella britannica]
MHSPLLYSLPLELLTGILECAHPASHLATSCTVLASRCVRAPTVQLAWAAACIYGAKPPPPETLSSHRPSMSPWHLAIPVQVYTAVVARNKEHTTDAHMKKHGFEVTYHTLPMHVFQSPVVLDHLLNPHRWSRLASVPPNLLVQQMVNRPHPLAPTVALLLPDLFLALSDTDRFIDLCRLASVQWPNLGMGMTLPMCWAIHAFLQGRTRALSFLESARLISVTDLRAVINFEGQYDLTLAALANNRRMDRVVPTILWLQARDFGPIPVSDIHHLLRAVAKFPMDRAFFQPSLDQ